MKSEERGARSERLTPVALVSVFALAANCVALAAPFSFDDIEFWVGDGANQAALVIDWVENSGEAPALAWGFRWDGTAHGNEMLAAIVAADPRLFAKVGGTQADPVSVYGLGYDADDDGQFGIDDGTAFNGSGFAFSGAADLATATDPDDYYAEGWFTGFWHYGVASANPFNGGNWSDTPNGMASRLLTDGAWDSWAFTPTFNFAAFADNPQAAPPPSEMPGDFNGDGSVDAADYVVWRKNDGTNEGYNSWRDHFGTISDSGARFAFNVPEPTALSLILNVFLLVQFAVPRKPPMDANPR